MTNADLHGDRREEPALAAGQASAQRRASNLIGVTIPVAVQPRQTPGQAGGLCRRAKRPAARAGTRDLSHHRQGLPALAPGRQRRGNLRMLS
jgi:hypothetical protein